MEPPDVYDMAAQSAESNVAVQDDAERESAAQSDADATDENYPHITMKDFKIRTYNGETPGENLPMPDRILWWAYREMYAQFKAGKISKEQGEEMQKAISRQYTKDRKKYDDYIKITKSITDLYKRIENAATAYIKSGNRTPEADALYEALYGVTLTDKE